MGQRSFGGGGARLDLSAFASPPVEYRGMPFWSWNDKVHKEELIRQLEAFRRAGLGGIFVHPRPGVWVPFLSEEYFALIDACVEYAKEHGLKVWMYDESGYPSGFAGGLLYEKRPDLAQKSLLCRVADARGPELPADEGEMELARFWVFPSDGLLGYERASADARPRAGAKLLRFTMYTQPPSDWTNGAPYTDVLHPEAAPAFLEIAYEPFRERYGREFGGVIPGCFTDEVRFRPSPPPEALGALPWTPDLPVKYRERYGEELMERLPELFFDTAHGLGTRYRFWKLLTHLFAERWVRPIYEWCDRHGLAFTGHFFEHSFNPKQTGSIGLPARWQHIPGVDLLGQNIALFRQKQESVYWQMGNVQMIKAVSSVARQFGRARVLSETYGAAGWEMSFEDQKQAAEWQAALGVNLLNQHLSHYSLRGERKHDHPPSFLDHQPWWSEYPAVHEYLARLHYALAQGRFEAEILVVHPMSATWVGYRPAPAPIPGAPTDSRLGSDPIERVQLALDHLLKELLEEQWSFDLGDECILAEEGVLEGDRLRVGEASYRAVIIPPTVNLPSEVCSLLARWAERGGKVAALAPTPALVDGEESPALAHLLARCHVVTSYRDLSLWLRSTVTRGLRLEGAGEEALLYTHVRRLERQRLAFVANMGLRPHRGVELVVQRPPGEPLTVERWSLADGTVSPVPFRRLVDPELGEAVAFTLDFAPGESHLVTVGASAGSGSPGEGSAPAPPAPRGEALRVLSGTSPSGRHEPARIVRRVPLRGAWQIERRDPNLLLLDRCFYNVDGKWKGASFLSEVKQELCARYDVAPFAFRDVQPWKKYAERPPRLAGEKVRLRFEVEIAFDPADGREIDLLLEEGEAWSVLVNGRSAPPPSGWRIDPAFRRIRLAHLLVPGKNCIEISRRFGEDVAFEPAFLIGDFAVETADFRTFRLVEERGVLHPGSWVHQGYPFFSGRIRCFQRVFLDEEALAGGDRVWLEFANLASTLVKVGVNGVDAGVVAWRPYRAEITPYLKAGENRVHLEVVNSLRNTLGPHHDTRRTGLVAPARWQPSDHWTDDYQLVPDGLPSEMALLFGSPV